MREFISKAIHLFQNWSTTTVTHRENCTICYPKFNKKDTNQSFTLNCFTDSFSHFKEKRKEKNLIIKTPLKKKKLSVAVTWS